MELTSNQKIFFKKLYEKIKNKEFYFPGSINQEYNLTTEEHEIKKFIENENPCSWNLHKIRKWLNTLANNGYFYVLQRKRADSPKISLYFQISDKALKEIGINKDDNTQVKKIDKYRKQIEELQSQLDKYTKISPEVEGNQILKDYLSMTENDKALEYANLKKKNMELQAILEEVEDNNNKLKEEIFNAPDRKTFEFLKDEIQILKKTNEEILKTNQFLLAEIDLLKQIQLKPIKQPSLKELVFSNIKKIYNEIVF